VRQLGILLGTAFGIAILGTLCEFLAARYMLSSLEQTWNKSREQVLHQKESFERLVGALYPKFVSDRLMNGDTLIVNDVPQVDYAWHFCSVVFRCEYDFCFCNYLSLLLCQATVFFSDIVQFSTIANRLNADQLLEWLGYTFGVMDHCADYFKIFKIKTIGDAYLAITGMQGLSDAMDAVIGSATVRTLKFASAVAQIFSGRYLHPDMGQCLAFISEKSSLLKREIKLAKRLKSMQSSSHDSSSNMCSSNSGTGSTHSKCPMRYGIAKGPVMTGVLPGKCPVFDIWGKTVNLACRMEV
jgi:class 3 adenylate cyclase